MSYTKQKTHKHMREPRDSKLASRMNNKHWVWFSVNTLDGSIVHIIILLLFIGSLIHHLIHQERPMCRGDIKGHILIGIHAKWKLRTMLENFHNSIASQASFTSLFFHCPISQNCSPNHRLYCLILPLTQFAKLCSLTLSPPHSPFWNHYFFKISCGLLVPTFKCFFSGLILTYFSETFTR